MKLFPLITFWITVIIYASLGIWFIIAPNALLQTFGVNESTPQFLTEIRAFYGGIELGIAFLMLILARRNELATALMLGGSPLACTALLRCIGMLLDEFSSLHLGLALFEAAGAVCCILSMRVSKPNSQVVSRQEN